MHGSQRERTGTEGPPAGPRYRRHLKLRPSSSPDDLERGLQLLSPDPFSSGTDERPGSGEQPDRDPEGFGPWFNASYPGECAGCWGVIDPGDRIRADGEGGYVCEDCGEDGRD